MTAEELWRKSGLNGEYRVIMNSEDEAICIIRTTNVYITTFEKVSEKHSFLEGEGDRTLEYWKNVHQKFFTDELKTIGQTFNSQIELICEEFEVV
ncbi:MAG: ASCH domain-containing protein [Oscillospiraceae bacterium]|nr:ASCH domain-containing protein [Oscillospiraceae bacterium]